MLHVRRLAAGRAHRGAGRGAGVCARGRGEVRLDGEELGPGDSARITGAVGPGAGGRVPAQVLVWELSG